MNRQHIWLFYERPGVWGLKVDGHWWEASGIIVDMPLFGMMREAQLADELVYPTAYLSGFGYACRHPSGTVILQEIPCLDLLKSQPILSNTLSS